MVFVNCSICKVFALFILVLASNNCFDSDSINKREPSVYILLVVKSLPLVSVTLDISSILFLSVSSSSLRGINKNYEKILNYKLYHLKEISCVQIRFFKIFVYISKKFYEYLNSEIITML